jgi:hypothetical protein
LDWLNERYVRVYCRDTPSWKVLPWEARALWLFLLRRMDRAGTMDLGKHGARGIAASVDMPLAMVEQHLATLLEDGMLVLEGDDSGARLRVPNYIAANETPSSPAERKRASRERARAIARMEAYSTVTKPDIESRNVTKSHAESHAVTRSHSVPYRTVPSLPAAPPAPSDPEGQPPPDPDGSREEPAERKKLSRESLPKEALQVAEAMAKHLHERDPGSRKLQPNSPEREKAVIAWADAIRLLHERDGRGWPLIAEVWRWARNDGFWSANILSGQTLRKQFDKLVQAMKRPVNGTHGRPAPVQPKLLEDWGRHDKETR